MAEPTAREGYVEAEPGLRLHYRVAGAGRPAVLVPGASLAAPDMAPLAAGRAVLFYDPRGRGRSDAVADPARLGLAPDLRDLEAVRRALGADRVALVGWSYLGGLVARYAAAHPGRVRRLVLVGAMPPRRHAYPGAKTPAELDARVAPRDRARLEDLRRAGGAARDPAAYCRAYYRVLLARVLGEPAALDRMRSDPCALPNEQPEAFERWARHVFGTLGAYDWRPEARTVAAPALIVHGAEDAVPLAAAREWAATLPGARLLVIPGAGHFPHLERPKVFFPAVGRFLRGEWPGEAERVPGPA